MTVARTIPFHSDILISKVHSPRIRIVSPLGSRTSWVFVLSIFRLLRNAYFLEMKFLVAPESLVAVPFDLFTSQSYSISVSFALPWHTTFQSQQKSKRTQYPLHYLLAHYSILFHCCAPCQVPFL